MVKDAFDVSYQKTTKFESDELTNDPADRGKQTFCGISRRSHPDWPGWALIDAGNLEAAKALVKPFYKSEYWDRLQLGKLLDPSVAGELFDTAVNCGKKKAVMILQEALHLLRQDVCIDGIFGDKTLVITNDYKYPRSLLKVMNGLQFEHYRKLCEKDPTQLKFFRGWMERV